MRTKSANDTMSNYTSLFGTKDCIDFQFVCGDTKEVLDAHKIILLSRSNYLKSVWELNLQWYPVDMSCMLKYMSISIKEVLKRGS